MEPYDVIVIGMGPGGEHVAGALSGAGLAVLGVENGLVGGECPIWGCVPSKMMIRAGDALAEARRVPVLGGDVQVRPDWRTVAARIRDEVTDNWDDRVAVERFQGKGGAFRRGTGRLVGPREVQVDGQEFTARRGIVVATGSRPWVPPVDGLDRVAYWTNREAIEVTTLPASLVVLGGGAIGCELGAGLRPVGVTVTVVEAAPQLLPAEEPEVGRALRGVLAAEGITVHVGVGARRVDPDGDGVVITLGGSRVTDPEIGSVGLTENAARQAGVDIRVGATPMPGTARRWIHKTGNEGLIKLVEDADRGVLVGATVMGPAAGEVLGALALAVHAEVPTGTLRSMIHAYPTFQRGIEDALRALA